MKSRIVLFLLNSIFFLLPITERQITHKYIYIKFTLSILFMFLFVINFKSILHMKFNKIIRQYIYMVISFDIYVLIIGIFKESYYENHFIYNINLTLLFLLIGYSVKIINVKSLLSYFITGTTVLAICFYINNYIEGINYDVYTYTIKEKNSLGIFFVLSLLCIENIVWDIKNKLTQERKYHIEKLVCIIFMFFINLCALMLVRNRSGIIGFTIASCYIIYKKYDLKILALRLIFVSSILLLFWDNIYKFVYWSFGIRIQNSIDELSSGRISLFKETIEIIKHNIWIGIGNFYVDNLYLNFLASFGVIGFIFIISLLYIFVKILQYAHINKDYFIIQLIVYMFVVSLFESLLPFGPGLAVTLFWIILGNYIKKISV